ncbi:DUF3219 family protein [Metabacillus iocasae]|uniref:DUF3219 family protein n=1 Tax=Priestia iocasae TaxID=2291674 RepID=A0ABS2QW20_9BACI|nr:DUF3219 family protein [Metabacillus iocasae]MBM7703595.1 hypothetical protein [Metabacillus iocasae]
MVSEVRINDVFIPVEAYEEEVVMSKQTKRPLRQVMLEFKVKSEDYHEITTLLYNEVVNIHVPAKNVTFTGKINEYSTSITNLYKANQVGDFKIRYVELEK